MKVIQKVQEKSLCVYITWPRLRCRIGTTSKLVVPDGIVGVKCLMCGVSRLVLAFVVCVPSYM